MGHQEPSRQPLLDFPPGVRDRRLADLDDREGDVAQQPGPERGALIDCLAQRVRRDALRPAFHLNDGLGGRAIHPEDHRKSGQALASNYADLSLTSLHATNPHNRHQPALDEVHASDLAATRFEALLELERHRLEVRLKQQEVGSRKGREDAIANSRAELLISLAFQESYCLAFITVDWRPYSGKGAFSTFSYRT